MTRARTLEKDYRLLLVLEDFLACQILLRFACPLPDLGSGFRARCTFTRCVALQLLELCASRSQEQVAEQRTQRKYTEHTGQETGRSKLRQAPHGAVLRALATPISASPKPLCLGCLRAPQSSDPLDFSKAFNSGIRRFAFPSATSINRVATLQQNPKTDGMCRGRCSFLVWSEGTGQQKCSMPIPPGADAVVPSLPWT